MIELVKDSYTKEEVQGLLQSETDKVRTDYSKRLKAVEAERDALKPAQKSEAELALDSRTAELAHRERVLACKEAGFDAVFADLLKDDADLSKLGELLQAGTGYQPKGHRQSAGLTKEAFQAMSYSEQAKIYTENPSIIETLR